MAVAVLLGHQAVAVIPGVGDVIAGGDFRATGTVACGVLETDVQKRVRPSGKLGRSE